MYNFYTQFIRQIVLLLLYTISLCNFSFGDSDDLSFINRMGENKIMATVNGVTVTNFDIFHRIKIMKFFNILNESNLAQFKNLSGSLETNIKKTVKDQLVLEILLENYLQERIPTSLEEVETNIANIEAANNLPKGFFKQNLSTHNIPYQAFQSFIKSNIIRSRLMFTVTNAARPTKDELIQKIMENPDVSTLNISGYIIKYSPKQKSLTKSILKTINNSSDVTEIMKKIPGVEVVAINKNLKDINNSKFYGIWTSLNDNESSKAIDIIENGVHKKQIIYLSNIKFDMNQKINQNFGMEIAQNKSNIILNKLIEQMKSGSMIDYK